MTGPVLHLDFETRSTVDLRRAGVHRYAEHPDTGIWLASYAFDEEEPQTWWISGPNMAPMPSRIIEHVEAGAIMYAHNAEFERVMWRDVLARAGGIPVPSVEQWYDTAAEAAAMSLPRNLANVTVALGLAEKKDAAGGRLMLQLARPRRIGDDGRPVWWEDLAKLERLAAYGLQDVRAERAVYHAVNRLGKRERQLYLLDQRANDRGVGLDIPLVRAMKSLAEEEIDAQDAKIADVTEGAVEATTQVARIRDWLLTRGVETDSIDKANIRDLLARSDLPPDVAIALTARAEAAKSSVKKLGSMLETVSRGNRMRGMLLFHGASTGRWAGRLVQLHNFPRGEVPDIETYIPMVLDGTLRESLSGAPSLLTVLSSMLKSTIVAEPGSELFVADYSAIEARVLAWLAQEPDLLAAFRSGRPLYKEMAAEIFGRPVDSIEKGTIEYQIGKGTILGAGYGMGGCRNKDRPDDPSKFELMVKAQTGVEISPEFSCKAIRTYRDKYPRVPELWYATNAAAIRAVESPGEVFAAGPAKFTKRGAYLWMVLPSGRALAYHQPKIVDRLTPWGVERPAVEVTHQNQVTRQWERTALYGGLLVENMDQAIARDVMGDGMLAAEGTGYPVILTVHDEIVSERSDGGGSVGEFVGLLTREPAWAPGLPVAAEGWKGARYKK